MKLLRTAPLLATVVWSCTKIVRSPAIQVTETDYGPAKLVSIAGPIDSLPEWRLTDTIATVGGKTPPALGSVGDVRFLADGRLVIEDNQANELHLVSPTGSNSRMVGRRGEGPGEFANITKVTVSPGDTIFVYDRRLVRLSVFDSGGAFVRDMPIERKDTPGNVGQTVWASGSDRLLVQTIVELDTSNAAGIDTPRRNPRNVLISALDATGRTVGSEVSFPGGFSIALRGDMASPFSPRPIVAVGANRIVYGLGDEYHLVVADRDLRPLRTIQWEGWKAALTPEIVDSVREAQVAGLGPAAQARPDLAQLIVKGMFSPESLPESIPALGAVYLSDDELIWVSRFALIASDWNEQGAWHVLDAEGRPVGRLRLPPRTRLAAVKGDRVAVVTRDSLDLESVRVRRLVKN